MCRPDLDSLVFNGMLNLLQLPFILPLAVPFSVYLGRPPVGAHRAIAVGALIYTYTYLMYTYAYLPTVDASDAPLSRGVNQTAPLCLFSAQVPASDFARQFYHGSLCLLGYDSEPGDNCWPWAPTLFLLNTALLFVMTLPYVPHA